MLLSVSLTVSLLLVQSTPPANQSKTPAAAPTKAATASPSTAPSAAKSTTPATGAPATAAPKPAVAAAKPAAAAPKPAAPKPLVPQTDAEKTVYALGLSMARSLEQFDLSAAELEMLKQAVTDAAAKKPAVSLDDWNAKIGGLVQERRMRVTDKEKAKGKDYLDALVKQPGVSRTDSGIVYQDLTPGTGASPNASDTVRVHYRGTLIDKTEFDSSYKRGQPAEFPLNGVIKCWTEGVQKMKVGGKALLGCPSNLAYGDGGNSGIPGGATLMFEVELLDIVK